MNAQLCKHIDNDDYWLWLVLWLVVSKVKLNWGMSFIDFIGLVSLTVFQSGPVTSVAVRLSNDVRTVSLPVCVTNHLLTTYEG